MGSATTTDVASGPVLRPVPGAATAVPATGPAARPVLVRVGPDREHDQPVLVVVRQRGERSDREREVVEGTEAELMATALELARRHRMVAVGQGVWVARPPHALDEPVAPPTTPFVVLS